MDRSELEHALRAAKAVTGETEFIILGSQAILGSLPHAPEKLRMSAEVDMYPRNNPALSDQITGSLGEGSPFELTHGFYIDGCGPETSQLPQDWHKRVTLVCNINTDHAKGFCIHPSDAAYAKLYAGRPKDFTYVQTLFEEKIIAPSDLTKHLKFESDAKVKSTVEKNLQITLSKVASCGENNSP